MSLPSQPVVAYVNSEGKGQANSPASQATYRLYEAIAAWYDLPVISPMRAMRSIVDSVDDTLSVQKLTSTLSPLMTAGVRGAGHMRMAAHELNAAVLYNILAPFVPASSSPPPPVKAISSTPVRLPLPMMLSCDEEDPGRDDIYCHLMKGAHLVADFGSDDVKLNLVKRALASGWLLAPDHKDRGQGWISCAGTTPTNSLSMPLVLRDGELCVGYLRSYSANMGAVRVDLSRGGALGPEGEAIVSHYVQGWDPTRHVSVTNMMCFASLDISLTWVTFTSIMADAVPSSNRHRHDRRRGLRENTRRNGVDMRNVDMPPRHGNNTTARALEQDNENFCAEGGKFKLISFATF
mmetsp:Transcript_76646/g.219953  ORF Transcript_76646/g.219953 Transcript_76646/m.219953 type:complete len:350 (-) Transcript_76646:405-1454(-)